MYRILTFLSLFFSLGTALHAQDIETHEYFQIETNICSPACTGRDLVFFYGMEKPLPDQDCLDIDVKGALENVLLSDLKTWNRDHLVENQVFKKRKLFKN